MSELSDLFPQKKQLDPNIPRAEPGMGLRTGFDVVEGQDQTELIEQKTIFAIIRPNMALFEGLADYNKGDMRKFFENQTAKFVRLRVDIMGEASDNEYEEWVAENPVIELKTWEQVKDKIRKREPKNQEPIGQLEFIP